jgi:hypothetical protein
MSFLLCETHKTYNYSIHNTTITYFCEGLNKQTVVFELWDHLLKVRSCW